MSSQDHAGVKEVNIMKVTVNLNLDPVAFYQQKMLLVELTDKFFRYIS